MVSRETGRVVLAELRETRLATASLASAAFLLVVVDIGGARGPRETVVLLRAVAGAGLVVGVVFAARLLVGRTLATVGGIA